MSDSKQIDSGGPAFPIVCVGEYSPGMTLRDWFAGQALAGLMSIRHNVDNVGESQIAREAYMQADAMLKARNAQCET